jgi:hypothetical protein
MQAASKMVEDSDELDLADLEMSQQALYGEYNNSKASMFPGPLLRLSLNLGSPLPKPLANHPRSGSGRRTLEPLLSMGRDGDPPSIRRTPRSVLS